MAGLSVALKQGASPALQLLYLPVRARAENIRMMLHFKKYPFEDKILSFPEFFALQSELPSEQLPVLEVSLPEQPKIKLAQSGSISRYLATLLHLTPPSPLVAAQHDAIFETAMELTNTMQRRPGMPVVPSVSRILNWTAGQDQQQHTADLFSEQYLPRYLRSFTKAIGGSTFFGGAEPMYADFMVFHVLNVCESLRPGGISALSPDLFSWMSRIEKLPGVSEYLATRPPLESLGMHRQNK